MATTTTNFGWDIPQSTDLVKDGATAIAALGQDIDTAFVDFKGGTTGQVLKKTSGTDLDVEWGTASSGLTLINTTSFSAVATQSVNDVFSATYDTYQIIINVTSSSTATARLRLRVGGADNSSSNYENGSYYVGAYQSGTAGSINSDLLASFSIGRLESTVGMNGSFHIFNPFTTNYTKYLSHSVGENLTIGAGVTTVTTSYTGFTLLADSGTMTGAISVFGVAK